MATVTEFETLLAREAARWHRGVVKSFGRRGGYGFLRPDEGGEDVFFHGSRIAKSETLPQAGDAVLFQFATDSRGRRVARAVVVLE
jgi:cold shock CspA family protein